MRPKRVGERRNWSPWRAHEAQSGLSAEEMVAMKDS